MTDLQETIQRAAANAAKNGKPRYVWCWGVRHWIGNRPPSDSTYGVHYFYEVFPDGTYKETFVHQNEEM